MKYELINPIKYNNVMYQILTTRGIKEENILHFLNTSSADVFPPLLLDNIDNAIKMLITHIHNNDNIYVIIDPDCDGFTSSAVLLNYLNSLFPNHVQTKFKYGLHSDKTHGISGMKIPENTKLVICPDSSSNDYDLHKELKDKDIDVLVLDHHEAEKVSEYACVVNNQLCNYPTKSLSGVGIVYKFCCRIDEIMKTNYAENYLDLVALGLVSDMMDTRDYETQYFIQTGLLQVQNPYFREMISRGSRYFKDHVYMNDVAWYIAPYINAVTREGTLDEKLLLFEAMLEYKAYEQIPSTKRGCKGLFEPRSEQAGRTTINVKKRQDDNTANAIALIEEIIAEEGLLNNKILAVRLPGGAITKNLNGLAANKLANKYQRPALVLQQVNMEDGIHWAGSARGYDKSGLEDLREFELSTGLVDYAEGHGNAHGISISDLNFDKFIAISNEKLTMIDGNVKYGVDYIWRYDNIPSTDVLVIADYKELWGQQMNEPLIAIENVKLTSETLRFIGQSGKTMRIDMPNNISAIKFSISDEEKTELQVGGETWFANLIVKCEKNEWMGSVTPQFQIVDMEIVRKQKYYF